MKKLLALCLTVVITSCAAAVDYLKQAQSLTSQFSPDAQSLLARNASLSDRLGKLPTSLEGVSDTAAALGTNKATLQTIDAAISGGPTAIESALANKNVDQAKSLYDSGKSSSEKLPAAKSELDALEKKVAELETKRPAEPAPVATPAPAPAVFGKKLSDGTEISGNLHGIEAELIAFIEDGSRPVDKTTWFDFDRLTFKTGSADLDMDKSQAQLGNIAAILKVYSKVTVKVGGYTDNVGNAKSNLALSEKRAKNVAASLTKLGIAASRLSPEGYGDQHPECPANDTDECRAKNRRISVRVTAK